MTKTKKISMKSMLDAMLDGATPLHPSYIYRLSDLSGEDLVALKKAWPNIPLWRRQAIMEDVEEIGQSDYVLSFEALARHGLMDSDPRVRELAVRTLWEYESPELIPDFLAVMETDEDAEVRAVAATALGKYVFLGEIEEIPPASLRRIEDKLLQVTNGPDSTLVRRRALEALGYSSREEVPALIETAYASDSVDWQVSSLFAMGVSANREWNPSVMAELDNDNFELLYEAVRAAGELEISESLPRLLELLASEDSDVRMAAAWSLSQIGGEGVRDALEELFEEVEDDEEADLIESALENLDFTEDVQLFGLMDIPDEESEDEDWIELDEDEIDEDEDEDEE
jgi:HEAT repeat protein